LNFHKPLALTPGEPAGIGIDCIIQLAQKKLPASIVVIADKHILLARAKKLNLSLYLEDFNPLESYKILPAQHLWIKHIPSQNPNVCGIPDKKNSHYILETLQFATKGCLNGEFIGLVTGPVQKSILLESGIDFSGHTEYLAELCHVKQTIMLFVYKNMRVALTTTHLPLIKIAEKITKEHLRARIILLREELQRKFHIRDPKIIVSGLNPHAGEQGYLGREEIDVINPVIQSLQQNGYKLTGPLSADTLFTPQQLKSCDAILMMYHDQALPAIKALSFGKCVNVTLGLPFIRTSVDHGTALEKAGTGLSDPESLLAAIKLAKNIHTDSHASKSKLAKNLRTDCHASESWHPGGQKNGKT
jgi:4-hydroxythreonine-4-phosphate dehydrogenase